MSHFQASKNSQQHGSQFSYTFNNQLPSSYNHYNSNQCFPQSQNPYHICLMCSTHTKRIMELFIFNHKSHAHSNYQGVLRLPNNLNISNNNQEVFLYRLIMGLRTRKLGREIYLVMWCKKSGEIKTTPKTTPLSSSSTSNIHTHPQTPSYITIQLQNPNLKNTSHLAHTFFIAQFLSLFLFHRFFFPFSYFFLLVFFSFISFMC